MRAKRARFGGTTVLLCGTNYWYKLVPLYSGTKSWYKSVPLYSGTNGRAKRAPIFGMCARSARDLGTPLYCGVVLIPGTNQYHYIVVLNPGTNTTVII